jgi:hypothetical protein
MRKGDVGVVTSDEVKGRPRGGVRIETCPVMSATRSASPSASPSESLGTSHGADATHKEEPGADATHKEEPKSALTEDAEKEAGENEEDDGQDQSKETSEEPEASTSTATVEPAATDAPPSGSWQAIWSPSHNSYYFYNSETQETTWVNPLQPQPEASISATSAVQSSSAEPKASSSAQPGQNVPPHLATLYAAQAAAAAQGIDPSLAYLDPSLNSPGGASGVAYAATAKFNARTGAFAKVDARDPSHLSEYERAKRMSEFYFDVGQWENEVEKRKAEEAEEEESGRKKKKLTKKDLVRTLI